MHVPSWFTTASAAGFWALLGLLGLGALKFRRDMHKALEEDGTWHTDDWNWILDQRDDGIGMPLYVPSDLTQRAIEVLSQETLEQEQEMNDEQWLWTMNAMGVRSIIEIAHAEPNTELALLTWAAHVQPPDAEE